MPFPKEPIPDKDKLFRWVHIDDYEDDILNLRVFDNLRGGMSTDWEKYSTPAETKNRVKIWKRNPNEYGVLELNTGQIRQIEKQTVEHSPTRHNRSHTEVFGEKSPRIKIFFSRIYSWAIEPKK